MHVGGWEREREGGGGLRRFFDVSDDIKDIFKEIEKTTGFNEILKKIKTFEVQIKILK